MQTIHPGEADVENDQVVHARQRHDQALFTIGGDVHGIPLLLQTFLDEAGDFPFVFHNQDSHWRHPHHEARACLTSTSDMNRLFTVAAFSVHMLSFTTGRLLSYSPSLRVATRNVDTTDRRCGRRNPSTR